MTQKLRARFVVPVPARAGGRACSQTGGGVNGNGLCPLPVYASALAGFLVFYPKRRRATRKHAAGWIGFYWGKPPEELRRSGTISDALTLGWLELFQKKARSLEK
jgi:hypothetical protein